MLMVLLLIISIGLIFGSFINALVYRIENRESLLTRSFCPKCKKQIRWYDNIPVVGWLILRGKCRDCGENISIQYPFVELLTAFAFLITAESFGFTQKLNHFLNVGAGISINDILLAFLVLVVAFTLVLNAVYDYKTSYLLSTYIYVGIFASILFLLLDSPQPLSFDYIIPNILAGLVPASIFFALSYFSRGKWMGEGDWELVFLIGLFLGYPKIIIGLYFAFIVGALIGIIGMYQKKFRLKSAIPFGPFLIAGTFFALLFGEKLFSIYVRIILGG